MKWGGVWRVSEKQHSKVEVHMKRKFENPKTDDFGYLQIYNLYPLDQNVTSNRGCSVVQKDRDSFSAQSFIEFVAWLLSVFQVLWLPCDSVSLQ